MRQFPVILEVDAVPQGSNERPNRYPGAWIAFVVAGLLFTVGVVLCAMQCIDGRIMQPKMLVVGCLLIAIGFFVLMAMLTASAVNYFSRS